MTICANIILASCLLRFLDPWTQVYQTDDDAEGAKLSAEAGYWPLMQGQKDPTAKDPKPNIVHTVFRLSKTPYAEWDETKPNALFKVDQVGYMPDAPKYAYIGAWLGCANGAWKPHSPLTGWRLVDAESGETLYESPTPPVLRVKDGKAHGEPLTGEDTYEMDFSHIQREGEYYIAIDGLGRSENFRIASSSAEDAFRVHMQGLYQKRCGIAKVAPYTSWCAASCHEKVVRGTFAPDEGKLEPKCKWFDIIRNNTNWDGEKIEVKGGWHDAADYDRRPQHLRVVNDLCAVYLMKKENFRDGQLSIPENANGIADILDEAEWGLRHILAAQLPDGGAGTWFEGTRHPMPGNVAATDEIKYAVSRPTRRSSLMYAAHAALIARCDERLKAKYLESAKRAWDAAIKTSPAKDVFEIKEKSGLFTKTKAVFWTEDEELSASYLVKAAVNLSALTGDKRYIEFAAKELPRLLKEVQYKSWNWPPLLFSGEMELGTPPELEEFFKIWRSKVKKTADNMLKDLTSSHAYPIPWPGDGDKKAASLGWGICHPLVRAQYLIASHAMTHEKKYLDGALLANNFHNGCNMLGSTLTSGLGKTYPVKFLDLPSLVDGVGEYTPGITPYRWTTKIPRRALAAIWGGDEKKASRWPVWRRWWNLESITPGASEFTVWETIVPAASVTGYLSIPSSSTPPPPRHGVDDITTLPGYWVLP